MPVASPAGQVSQVRLRTPAGGTTVKFSRVGPTAGIPGTPQALKGRANVRVLPAVMEGGPNCPLNPAPLRVSAIRHGVIE